MENAIKLVNIMHDNLRQIDSLGVSHMIHIKDPKYI